MIGVYNVLVGLVILVFSKGRKMDEKDYDEIYRELIENTSHLKVGPGNVRHNMTITKLLRRRIENIAALSREPFSKTANFLLNVGVSQYELEAREEARIRADIENQSPEVKADYAHKAAEAEKYERFLQEFPPDPVDDEVPF